MNIYKNGCNKFKEEILNVKEEVEVLNKKIESLEKSIHGKRFTQKYSRLTTKTKADRLHCEDGIGVLAGPKDF